MHKILVLFLILISCRSATNVIDIKIIYVDKYMTSLYDISCGAFEWEFSQHLQKKTIVDVNTKKYILNRISLLSISQSNPEPFDTRLKCLILSSDKTDELCLDAFDGIQFNGQLMEKDTLLSQMIKNICWNHK